MKPILFMVCLLCCCTWGYGQSNDPLPAPPKKSMRITPVEISQVNHSLTISFHLSFGKVAVNIVSPSGTTAYRNTLAATAGTQWPVDTAGWTNGSYILRLTDEHGDIVCELIYYKE